jgi:hypothetical protein
VDGYTFGITVGGSIGSAHIGGRTAATYDNLKKEGEVTLMGHFGLGAGLKVGFSFSNVKQENKKKK